MISFPIILGYLFTLANSLNVFANSGLNGSVSADWNSNYTLFLWNDVGSSTRIMYTNIYSGETYNFSIPNSIVLLKTHKMNTLGSGKLLYLFLDSGNQNLAVYNL